MKRIHRQFLLSLALIAPSITNVALAVEVHSAAGVVPPLPRTSSSQAPAEPRVNMLATQRNNVSAPSTPPPLPRSNSQRLQQPIATTAAAAPPSAEIAQANSRPTVAKFDAALKESVTIDVVNMRFEDLLQQLKPYGWRMRFQNIEPSILDTRVDLTAEASRQVVLHRLLSQAGLSIEPFESFDVPLMLITRS